MKSHRARFLQLDGASTDTNNDIWDNEMVLVSSVFPINATESERHPDLCDRKREKKEENRWTKITVL